MSELEPETCEVPISEKTYEKLQQLIVHYGGTPTEWIIVSIIHTMEELGDIEEAEALLEKFKASNPSPEILKVLEEKP